MNTQQGSPPPDSDSGKKLSFLFVGVAAGAILTLLFVTVVLVAVLWRGGFFNSRNTSVAHQPRIERVERSESVTRTESPVNNYRPPAPPAPAPDFAPVAADPPSIAPILHIRSKTLNVLDGETLVMETEGEVRNDGGYLVIKDSEKLRIPGPFSLSVWFKPNTVGRPMTIGSRAINGPPWTSPFASWLMRLNTPTLLEASLAGPQGYSPSTWSVSEIQPGQWYHAVMTYDGNAKILFLNGVRQRQLASGSLNNPGGIRNTPGRSILIGADESESPAAEIFDGAIDDVRIFNRTLPEDEVQTIFNTGSEVHK